jgi:hypothetical protein
VASPGLEVNKDGKLIGIEEVSFTITSVSTESEDGKLIGIEEISFTIPSRISVYQRSIEIHQERLHIRRNMSLLVGNSSVILFLGKAMMFVNNGNCVTGWSSSRFQREAVFISNLVVFNNVAENIEFPSDQKPRNYPLLPCIMRFCIPTCQDSV